ncbi:MAG: hybrid sensor histidine kinase/response regulator [Tepidisphaeraceae bacterium]
MIERNARTQAQLIDDLLDMSRIISGRIRLEEQTVDLADVVKAAVDTVIPAAEGKRVHLRIHAPVGQTVVRGDPARLQQIIWNLLTNAVKFTPSDGEVRLRLSADNGKATLEIQDTGEGITPEFLPYLFDRFRQADGSITRRHGGLGLGLSIVRQLITLHRGTVTASSTGPGNGSTFVVRLPLVDLPAAVEDAADTPPADIRLDGVRVLAIDDHADARDILRRLLEQSGATVAVAGDAAGAVDQLLAHRPDVLVSDIGMPGEDGYALIRRVRSLADESIRHVPAVAVTAFAHADDGQRAADAGYQAHVAKPVNRDELVRVVAQIAAGRHAAS